MSPALRAAAEAVVKAPGWPWVPGMQLIDTFGRRSRVSVVDASNPSVLRGAIPDLDDPLTAAGLLVVARMAWAGFVVHVVPPISVGELWTVGVFDLDDTIRAGFTHDTEAEALIVAILAAPKETP